MPQCAIALLLKQLLSESGSNQFNLLLDTFNGDAVLHDLGQFHADFKQNGLFAAP